MGDADGTSSARIEIRSDMPDGTSVVPVEDDAGNWVWLIHEDHMTQEAADAVNRYMAHFSRLGMWVRVGCHDDDHPPRRRAS